MTKIMRLSAMLLLILISSVGMQAQTSSDTFLDVSFQQEGRFIDDIQVHELIIKGGGDAQVDSIESISELPLRIAFVVDASGSQREFVSINRELYVKMIDVFPLGAIDSACLVFFNEKLNIIQGMTSDKKLLLKEFDRRQYKGSTRLFDAVFSVSNGLGKNKDSRKAMIVISDGVDNLSGHKMEESFNEAIANNVRVYLFALKGNLNFSPTGQQHLQESRFIHKDYVIGTGGKIFQFTNIKSGMNGIMEVIDELTHLKRIRFSGQTTGQEKSDFKISVSRKGVKAYYPSLIK